MIKYISRQLTIILVLVAGRIAEAGVSADHKNNRRRGSKSRPVYATLCVT